MQTEFIWIEMDFVQKWTWNAFEKAFFIWIFKRIFANKKKTTRRKMYENQLKRIVSTDKSTSEYHMYFYHKLCLKFLERKKHNRWRIQLEHRWAFRFSRNDEFSPVDFAMFTLCLWESKLTSPRKISPLFHQTSLSFSFQRSHFVQATIKPSFRWKNSFSFKSLVTSWAYKLRFFCGQSGKNILHLFLNIVFFVCDFHSAILIKIIFRRNDEVIINTQRKESKEENFLMKKKEFEWFLVQPDVLFRMTKIDFFFCDK